MSFRTRFRAISGGGRTLSENGERSNASVEYSMVGRNTSMAKELRNVTVKL